MKLMAGRGVWLVVAVAALACSPSPASTTTLPEQGGMVPQCEGAVGEKLRGVVDDRAFEVAYSRPNALVTIRVENHTMGGARVVNEAGRIRASFRGYQDLLLVSGQLPPGQLLRVTTAGGEVIIPCRFAVGPLQTSLVVAVFPHQALAEAVVVNEQDEVVWEVDEPTLRQWADSGSFGSEFDIPP
jgi:hypothetical protein